MLGEVYFWTTGAIWGVITPTSLWLSWGGFCNAIFWTPSTTVERGAIGLNMNVLQCVIGLDCLLFACFLLGTAICGGQETRFLGIWFSSGTFAAYRDYFRLTLEDTGTIVIVFFCSFGFLVGSVTFILSGSLFTDGYLASLTTVEPVASTSFNPS